MKPLRALFALMLAFPLLYLGAAVLDSTTVSTAALALVAGTCVFLLLPERKE
jgi:hypothetical protein